MSIYKKNKKGLALIELVIVLGIIGVVFGAIWAAASSVREREQIHDAVQVIADISGSVRSIYTGFPQAAVPKNVGAQITGGLYPPSIVNSDSSDTINKWSGTYFIQFDATPPYRGFSIEVTMDSSISAEARRDACLGLLTRIDGFATNYIGGTSDTLPVALIPTEPAQGMGPALTFINNGGWVEATTLTPIEITNLITVPGCDGVAFYYKM